MFFFGKARTKEILFPLSFLIFMFPLPSSAINTISLPMKELVTNLGARFVSAIGIPVHHSGFYVDTAKGTLLIDDPCSGIRSLIAFMALGAVAGYIGKASTMMRVLLFAISILVALLMNTLRVSFLVGVTSHYGSGAAAPDTWAHDLSGYASFAIGALLLFEINRLLEWKK
jgi:exosortase